MFRDRIEIEKRPIEIFERITTITTILPSFEQLKMLNMESPQMYDAVQSLSHLDLKKQPPLQQAIIGQITLTAMSAGQTTTNSNNSNSSSNNNNGGNNNSNTNTNNNNNSNNNNSNTSISSNGSNGATVDNTGSNNNVTTTNGQQHQQQQHHQQQQLHHQQQQQQQQQHHHNHNSNHQHHHQNNSGLVVKQHAMHQLHNAAAALNNNNNASVLNANVNVNVNNVNNLLQKQMLHQYAHTDLDELTAQEISLDLQHLIDDQFRDQDTLGIFSDMVTSPAVLSATLPPNGNSMVSAAAKVLQQHQLQQQTLRTVQQQHPYGRSPLTYIPSSMHSSGGLPSYSNNSSDENSSIGSDSSTIKEEPIDPDYRRHLQEANSVTNNVAAAAFITNGIATVGGGGAGNGTVGGGVGAGTGNLVNGGLYNPYQNTNGNSNVSVGGSGGGNSGGSGGVNAGGGGGPLNGIVNPTGVGTGVLNQGTNNFNAALNSANVLAHHSAVNLPHLAAGAHLLKHHNKQMQSQRKSSLKHIDKGTEEYRRRRERNNIAVRKSREKAKVRSREVEERVKSLLKEKETLLLQLQDLGNELQLHKQIYMQLMNHTNPEVSRVCRSFLNASNDQGL